MKKTLRAMIITGLTFVAAGTYCHASAADLALRAVKDVSGTVSVDTGSGVSVKVSAGNTEASLPSKPELVVVKEKDIHPENHEYKGPDHVVIKEREIHPESIEHKRHDAIEHDRPSGRDRDVAVRDNMPIRGEHHSHNAEGKSSYTGDMHQEKYEGGYERETLRDMHHSKDIREGKINAGNEIRVKNEEKVPFPAEDERIR